MSPENVELAQAALEAFNRRASALLDAENARAILQRSGECLTGAP